jgi:alanine racemase
MPPLTWLDIDLEAIRNNVRRMAALAGTRVMAVVKANAYGHGAAEVARAAAEAGAAWLGVARADEGLALRAAGLDLPVLVLGYTPPALAAEALARNLTLTVVDHETGQACAAAAGALGRPARVHLKVDTGMGRLGVLPEAAPALHRALRALPGLEVEGVFTHFARADEQLAEADGLTAARQLARFAEVLQALEAPPGLRHAANSAAALTLPAARLDLVRMGIALYGLHPSRATPCPPNFRPALTWKARVAQVKTLPAGHGISYGHYYVTREPETVAVVTVGYADGYRRALHLNEVLIHGRRAPVRGRVCMDQVIAGVTHIPDVRPGDEAVLLGEQADPAGRLDALTADELAEKWKTINYDVTSGILPRVARLYR